MKHFDEINHEAVQQFHADSKQIEEAAQTDLTTYDKDLSESKRMVQLERIKNDPETRAFIDEVFTQTARLVDEYTEGKKEPFWMTQNSRIVPVEVKRRFRKDEKISEYVEYGPRWKDITAEIVEADTYTRDLDGQTEYKGRPRKIITYFFEKYSNRPTDIRSHLIAQELINFMEHYGYEQEVEEVAKITKPYDRTYLATRVGNLTFRLSEPPEIEGVEPSLKKPSVAPFPDPSILQ